MKELKNYLTSLGATPEEADVVIRNFCGAGSSIGGVWEENGKGLSIRYFTDGDTATIFHSNSELQNQIEIARNYLASENIYGYTVIDGYIQIKDGNNKMVTDINILSGIPSGKIWDKYWLPDHPKFDIKAFNSLKEAEVYCSEIEIFEEKVYQHPIFKSGGSWSDVVDSMVDIPPFVKCKKRNTKPLSR